MAATSFFISLNQPRTHIFSLKWLLFLCSSIGHSVISAFSGSWFCLVYPLWTEMDEANIYVWCRDFMQVCTTWEIHSSCCRSVSTTASISLFPYWQALGCLVVSTRMSGFVFLSNSFMLPCTWSHKVPLTPQTWTAQLAEGRQMARSKWAQGITAGTAAAQSPKSRLSCQSAERRPRNQRMQGIIYRKWKFNSPPGMLARWECKF